MPKVVSIRKEVMEMRQAVGKIVRLLSKKDINVVQRGEQARVEFDERTMELVRVVIPVICDTASDEFLGALQGFIDHEVGHILHTDFSVLVGVDNRDAVFLNGVEDVRIEAAMTKMFAGSGSNLERNRIRMINEYYNEEYQKLQSSPSSTPHDYFQVLAIPAFRAWGGQRSYIDWLSDKWHHIEPVVDKVEHLIPFFKTMKDTDDAMSLSQKLQAIIYPPQNKKDPCDDSEESDKSQDSEENNQSVQKEKSEGGKESGEDDGEEGSESESPESDAGDDSDSDEESEEGGEPGGEGDSEEGEESGDEDDSEEDEESEGEEGEEESDEDEESEGDEDDSEEGDEDEESEGEEEFEEEGEEESEEEGEQDFEKDQGKLNESKDEESSESKKDDSDDSEDGTEEQEQPLFDNSERFDFDEEEASKELLLRVARRDHVGDPYTPYTNEHDFLGFYDDYNRHEARITMERKQEQVKEMTSTMTRHLRRAFVAKNRSRYEGGKYQGKIDQSSIHRLRTGDPRIFKELKVMRTKDVAVSLVCDLSGSMKGVKLSEAVTAAWALGDVLQKLGINFEIVGFTTGTYSTHNLSPKTANTYTRVGESLLMPIFKQFGEHFGTKCKERLSGCLNEMNSRYNIDGECVRVAGDRILSQKEPGKTMIVLSDGQPASMSVGTQQLENHLLSVVNTLEAKGVNMVGIGIQSKEVKKFYRKHVIMNDISKLASEVVKQLGEAILAA